MLPGVAIIGAEAGGGYGAVSGTSVAAAQAAGLVAVLAAQHTDWSAARLRSALISTAALVRGLDAPLAPVQAQGGGRPDTATASARHRRDAPCHALARHAPATTAWRAAS